MEKGALSGVKVIEYSDNIGPAYAGRLFAMAGAEVIRVENPDGSNRLRNIGPFVGNKKDTEKSIPAIYCNPNKKSVTLDLDTEKGQQLMRQLLKDADIFVREGLPHWYDERGLDWERLHTENPKLNVVSITPFGEVGPYKNFKANPLNVIHMSGAAALNPHGSGTMDKAPIMSGGNFEQYDIGTMAAIGALAMLFKQRIDGIGQYLPISELESMMQTGSTEAVVYPVFGIWHSRAGALQKAIASLAVPCKDGFITPFLIQQHEVNAMAKMIGKEEWLEEEWFNDTMQRRANPERIAEALIDYCKDYTMKEISDLSQKCGASLGPTYKPEDVINDEQFAFREFFEEIDDPELGKVKYPGRPFIMHGTPFGIEFLPVKLGADNDRVFGSLGENIEKLKQENII